MVRKEDYTVDTTGLRCPEPLMVTRNKLMDMKSGEILKIIATDPSTSWDFPNYCLHIGHELISSEKTSEQYLYWIRKG